MPSEMAFDTAEKDIGRLEMLSDGVFAIAITLLGLELKVPGELPDGQSLLSVLAGQWHTYLAVVTSFFTILVVWLNHHGCIQALARLNIRFVLANGLLLLAVICFPFATGLVGAYWNSPHARMASAVYAGVCLLSNIGFNLMWLAAARHRALLKDELPDPILRKIRRGAILGGLAYLLAIAGAFLSAYVAIGICTMLWIAWTLTFSRFKEQVRVYGPARVAPKKSDPRTAPARGHD